MTRPGRSLRRRSCASAFVVITAVAAVVAATGGSRGYPVVHLLSTTQRIPSSQFWLPQETEEETPLVTPDALYEGNTDQVFLNLVKQAAALKETGHAWRSVGPFGGIDDILGTGSGAEEFGPVGGIGTAIAVDPDDPTGNTVYLGTIGGLYKSTNGGKTVTNIVDGQLPRVAIGAIAVDPKNPQTIYAGTGVSIFTLSDDAAGTGVYVTHNGGKTWFRPTANTHGYGVNSIVVSPTGTVFAATTYGLWRSTDRGASFTRVPLPTNAQHTGPAPDPLGNWTTAIAISPLHPDEVTVGVGYAFGKLPYAGKVIAPGNGLYRSTNDGKSFQYLASTSQLTNPTASSDPVGRISLAYSQAPGGGNILWAMLSDAGRAAGQQEEVDTPVLPVNVNGGTLLNGLYRSSDDGATWTLEANGQILTTALAGTTSAAGYALSYAAGAQAFYNNWVITDPKDVNRVYIGLEEAFQGEYHPAPTGPGDPPTTTFTAIEKYANACGFLSYFNTIPNNNGVPCPGVPFYGGGSTHPDQHSAAIALTPGGGYRMYSGNDGGWWAQDAHPVTDTAGVQAMGFDNTSWRSLNSPATVLPWDVTRLQDGSYLLALQDNGVAHVRPNGTAYQVCGGDGVYVFPGANPQSYYCGIDGQTILATTDDFKTTINVTPSDNALGPTFLSPWAVDPSDPNHLIAAAENVDETVAGPNTNTYDPTDEELLSSQWVTVFTPPPAPEKTWDSSAVYTDGPVSYVAFCSPTECRPRLANGSAADPALVHVAIATNIKPGCKPAMASTACWHMAAGKGLPHEQISGIAVDPTNPETVYVGLRVFIVMGADQAVTGSEKVMVSHNGGNSFTDLSGNLPRADVNRIALRDGRLYAATDVGVFTSVAGSTHWERFGTGLPEVAYRSMKLDPTGRYLTLGAYGRGAYVYDFGAPAVHPPSKPPTVPGSKVGSKSPGAAGGGSGSLPVTGGLPLALAGLAAILVAAFLGRHRHARR